MANDKPGPKTLAERIGEPTTMIKIMVTESQKEFVMNQGVSAAEYIRMLIRTDMAIKQIGVGPDEVNTEVLQGMSIIIGSLQKQMT